MNKTTTELINIASKFPNKNIANLIEYQENGSIKIQFDKEFNELLSKNVIDSEYFSSYEKNLVKKNIADSFLLKKMVKIVEPYDVVEEAAVISKYTKRIYYRPGKVVLDNFTLSSNEALFDKGLKNTLGDKNFIKNFSFIRDLGIGVLKTGFDKYYQDENKIIGIYTLTNETRNIDKFQDKMVAKAREAYFDNFVIGQESSFESYLIVGEMNPELIQSFINGAEIPIFKVTSNNGILNMIRYNSAAHKVYPAFLDISLKPDIVNSLNGIKQIIDKKYSNILHYEKNVNPQNEALGAYLKAFNEFLIVNNWQLDLENENECVFFNEKTKTSISINELNFDQDVDIKLTITDKKNFRTDFVGNEIADKFIESIKNIIEISLKINQITRDCEINKRADKTLQITLKKHISGYYKFIFNSVKNLNSNIIFILKQYEDIPNKKSTMNSEINKAYADFNKKTDLSYTYAAFFTKLLLKNSCYHLFDNNDINFPLTIINTKMFDKILALEKNIDKFYEKKSNDLTRYIVYDTETTGLFNSPKKILGFDEDKKFIVEFEAEGLKKDDNGNNIYGWTENGTPILYKNQKEKEFLLKNNIEFSDIDNESINLGVIQDEIVHFAAIVLDIDKHGNVADMQCISEKFNTNIHLNQFLINIHHVSNKDVINNKYFTESKDDVLNFLNTADVISGYNINKYDKRAVEICFNNEVEIYNSEIKKVVDGVEIFRILNNMELMSTSQDLLLNEYNNEKQQTKHQEDSSIDKGVVQVKKTINTLDNASLLLGDPIKAKRVFHHPVIDVIMSYNVMTLLSNFSKNIIETRRNDIKQISVDLLNLVKSSVYTDRDKYNYIDDKNNIELLKKNFKFIKNIDEYSSLDLQKLSKYSNSSVKKAFDYTENKQDLFNYLKNNQKSTTKILKKEKNEISISN